MFKRVLVPIETKEKSENAINLAFTIGDTHKAEIILFHVINAKKLDLSASLTQIEREEKRKILEEDVFKMLFSIKKDAPGERMKVFIDIVEGEPASKICEVATKNKVDLIIMPKTGKIGVRRVLVGDISIKVLECTDIPVMLVV